MTGLCTADTTLMATAFLRCKGSICLLFRIQGEPRLAAEHSSERNSAKEQAREAARLLVEELHHTEYKGVHSLSAPNVDMPTCIITKNPCSRYPSGAQSSPGSPPKSTCATDKTVLFV